MWALSVIEWTDGPSCEVGAGHVVEAGLIPTLGDAVRMVQRTLTARTAVALAVDLDTGRVKGLSSLLPVRDARGRAI